MRGVRAAWCPLDRCRSWHSRLCSGVETASAQIVEPPPSRAAHRKHLTRHEPRRLKERPGDPRRANASHPIEPRLSRLLLAARDLCDGKSLPQSRIPRRVTDARCMHFSRTACQRQPWANRIIDVGGPAGYLAGRLPLYYNLRPRRGADWRASILPVLLAEKMCKDRPAFRIAH